MKTFWLTFAFLFDVDVAATCTTAAFVRLPDCVTDYAHPANATSTTTVTSLVDCLKECTQNAMCTAVNVCRDLGGTYYCHVMDVDKVTSCASLKFGPGCSYLQLDEKNKKCLNGGVLYEANNTCICPLGINGDNCDILFTDCTKAYESGLRVPGNRAPLLIQPVGSPRPFTALCFLNYGGYTNMEYRVNSAACSDLVLNLTWEEMKYSVGDLNGCSFWLGLEYLHQLTSQANYKLDVFVPEWPIHRHALYVNFNIGNESSGYVITYDRYKKHPKPADDGFEHDGVDGVRGKPFATIDRPDTSGCAKAMGTAWWYGTACPEINLHLPLSGVPALNHASWVNGSRLYTLKMLSMVLKRIE